MGSSFQFLIDSDIGSISQNIERFSSFSKNAENRFNHEMLELITSSVRGDAASINEEGVSSFFREYYDVDILTLPADDLNSFLYETFSPYTRRNTEVSNELPELKRFGELITRASLRTKNEKKGLENRFWKNSFTKSRIEECAEEIDTLAVFKDIVDENMLRRCRWTLDLLLGDYYVIFSLFSHLLFLSKTSKCIYTRSTILRHLSNLIEHNKESISYYKSSEREMAERYLVSEFCLLKINILDRR